MIYESSYWKKDLLQKVKTLKDWKRKRSWGEPSMARLEQLVMLGFYTIRKLSEAHKLSKAVVERKTSLVTYPWRGKPVTVQNWHDADELYDLNNPGTESKDLIFICHQIVHSYVFSPGLTRSGRLEAILFCSDRLRHSCLFSLPVSTLVQLFQQVGNDYPASARLTFNQKTQDYDVENS